MAESEEAIVRRAQQGDREAFRALFERYRNRVYGYIRQMVRADDLAADLTQEVFLRAYQSLPRLKAPGAFRGWLYQISEEDAGELALPDPTPGPERVAVRAHLSEAVSRALARLAPERRAVVILHHLRGLSVREIARAMNTPEGTIKSRLGRARADLKQHLADWMEE
jgi:RNA polymerase sigma-70 factor (ECF subfamily)